ncbi:hypothetical protein LOD99_8788 [Oopsacas minuta]|uniref:Transposase n=1 Tax=Oopsacas minuta TaxID=111878 RepID=A0AAV7JFB7_9METZ|nr:hypothetical protein LOD99_8788 [Oopsacas minuta]
MRFWALKKPEPIAQRPLSTEKVVVWCAVAYDRIIGSYFFEDEDGKTCTVNRWRYLAMPKGFYLPNIRRHGELNTITFHQDGAPPHYANLVRGWLQEKFGDRGYLKSVVYRDPVPKTLEDLKNNIRREIKKINGETLAKVYDNMLVRLQRVLGRKGAWIEHLING